MDIDNVRENARQVTHDYAVGNIVCVEMTGVYHKLDYKKQGLYIIKKNYKQYSSIPKKTSKLKHKYKTVEAPLR